VLQDVSQLSREISRFAGAGNKPSGALKQSPFDIVILDLKRKRNSFGWER